jgi:purine nucleoside permease
MCRRAAVLPLCLTFLLLSAAILVANPLPAQAVPAASAPWPIRVVIVTAFEPEEDTGDHPGELQFWVERERLDKRLDFPGGVRELRTNAAHTVLGIVTGMTLANAGPSIMALGLDPRFDLSHAYWLVSGIAGVDPEDASLGSAAWARFVVNDVTRQLDPREVPANWPYGIFAIGAHEPNQLPPPSPYANQQADVFPLNGKLATWAFAQTRDLKLKDTPEIAAVRAKWSGYPNAQKPPFVLMGDSFASDAYWHGKIMTQFANDWVRLWTHNQGNFVMSNMEDSAIAAALRRLDAMHRADYRRLLVLRTASNYTMQPPGESALESVNAPYVGGIPALESAYRVGSTVVHLILADWPRWKTRVPGD